MMTRVKLFIAGLIFLGFFGTIANAEITDGLVSHWGFDEGSGTVANDSAGTNTGTLVNSPVWTTGQIGNALSFDGSGAYVDVGDTPSLNIAGKYITMSAWIYRNNSANGQIIRKRGINIGYQIYIRDNRLKFHAGEQSSATSVSTIPVGEWVHVAAVADGTHHIMYINGQYDSSVSSTTDIIDSSGISGRIGAIPGYGYDFNGAIDEVMIFNRALSAEEIRELYGVDNTRPIANAGGNQTVYAWIDGVAEVCLNGSGSFDEDGDELTYLWNWIVNGEPCSVTGVSPVIKLPAGEYAIQLVVNDGYEDSLPNEVAVTVIEPLKAELQVMPKTLNQQGNNIIAMLRMPEGVELGDIDRGEKLVLYPGGVKAEKQLVLGGRGSKSPVSILAFFNRAEFVSKVEKNGIVEVDITGKLKSGRCFYGTDSIRVIGR